jgi:hypothetical protein
VAEATTHKSSYFSAAYEAAAHIAAANVVARAFSIQVFTLAAHFRNAFSNEIECSFCRATTKA